MQTRTQMMIIALASFWLSVGIMYIGQLQFILYLTLPIGASAFTVFVYKCIQ